MQIKFSVDKFVISWLSQYIWIKEINRQNQLNIEN